MGTEIVKTTGNVGRGAIAGAVMGLSSRLLGPIFGNLLGAVLASFVYKGEKDTIALISGIRIADGILGAGAQPVGGTGDSGQSSVM